MPIPRDQARPNAVMADESDAPPLFSLPVSSIILVIVAICVVGYLAFDQQKQEFKQQNENNLNSIATLKVGQISNWLDERRNDAASLTTQTFLVSAFEEWLRTGASDNASKKWMLSRLGVVQRAHHYEAMMLLDEQGMVRLSTAGPVKEQDDDLRRLALAAMRDRRVMMNDLHWGQANKPELGFVAPLLHGEGDGSRVVGGLYFRIDPADFLFPLIQSWPTVSKTAETLLIRRDGDEVVFLNELRHRTGTALRLRLPLGKSDLHAARAALGGSGFASGHDYRGHTVVSYVQQIPGANWAMVAKIDEAEIYAPIHMLALYVSLVVIMLVAFVIFAFWWHLRRAEYIAKNHQAMLKNQALVKHFNFLSKFANDIILLMDGQGRILKANDRAVETYGYSREEMLKMAALDLRAAEISNGFSNDWQPLHEKKCLIFETLHQRKDGTTFPVEASVRLIETEGKEFIQGIIRDITERKAAEKTLARLSQLYKMLSETNAAIIHVRERKQLMDVVCRIVVESGLFRMVWIGSLDRETGAVLPVAQGGYVDGYLDNLNINVYDSELGKGPTGRAIRQGAPVVCDDIAQDPYMQPWIENALRRGYKASAVFPLTQGGLVVGAFNLYFHEAGVLAEDVVQLIDGLAADISFALDFIDETKRRERAEREIKSLNSELEQRVIERTLQLEMANKELEAFSYSVSHDLRAPLRSIDGFSQVLLKGYADQFDAKGRDYLERVRRASQRMGDLIDDMLHLSRVTRGEVHKEQVDLSRMAQEIANNLKNGAPERRVEFVIEKDILVNADARLLRIVLENLLGNAWKFTGKQPEAKIELGTEELDGVKAIFVRDNGAGFNMEYAHKLFSPFQRLHGMNDFEGSGIGLATVQRIIHRHGGRVWAEGREGQGATFFFSGTQERKEVMHEQQNGDLAGGRQSG